MSTKARDIKRDRRFILGKASEAGGPELAGVIAGFLTGYPVALVGYVLLYSAERLAAMPPAQYPSFLRGAMRNQYEFLIDDIDKMEES